MEGKTLIIIPTYNEIENIESIVHAVFNIVPAFHVLVVDDNSPDGTANVVSELKKKYSDQLFLEIRSKKTGLGDAYVHGFRWALQRQYSYVFEMDADFSHDPKELIPMQAQLLQQADVVVGSRYSNGVNVVNWPLSRVLLSYFASIYVRWITHLPVKDATAGFVGYTRNVLTSMDIDSIRFGGYAFQIELKYKAWIKGFKIVEHPIIFVNRQLGKSKMSGNIIWEALFGVLYLRWNKRKFK
ncbi:MAG: polyprenol monophosphomannose synthase [Flavobacteriaceae bacterium]|nr:polyprenol monophosphomannose synthase [Flavobacteriia bacterium]